MVVQSPLGIPGDGEGEALIARRFDCSAWFGTSIPLGARTHLRNQHHSEPVENH
jgi:hypothetical protein